MKSLVCESCGGIDFLQGKGFYVCSACGTKIVAEKNEADVEKLLKAARQARDVGNWQLAGDYYDKVLAEDAENWEAVFFSSACRAYSCVIANISLAAQQTAFATVSALMLVASKVNSYDEQKSAVEAISTHCIVLGESMYSSAMKHYNSINDASLKIKYRGEASDRVSAAFNLVLECGQTIDKLFDDKRISVYACVVMKKVVELIDKINIAKLLEPNKETVKNVFDIISKTDEKFIDEYNAKKTKIAESSRKAMRIGLIVAVVCVITGVILRYVSTMSFWPHLSAGQTFCEVFGIGFFVFAGIALFIALVQRSIYKSSDKEKVNNSEK